MAHPLRGAAAIVGVGMSALRDTPGQTQAEIIAAAAHGALADAGVELQDVDGIFVASAEYYLGGLTIAEYLGIHPKYTSNNHIGGSSFEAHVIEAAMALRAGLCSVALICYGSNQRSAAGKLVSKSTPLVWESAYKPRNPPSAYALAAARHMYEFGTTREQLAEVAVAARKWAQLNPEAQMRDPLTVDDVINARMVCDPFTVRDCCLVTDGGGAIVMVRADRAKDHPKAPVYVLGGAMAHWHNMIAAMPDLTVSAAAESGPRAFRMAGYEPKDMDVVELYDAFTINTILFLEDLGFCEKGEGGAFVADGRIAPGGALPVNTNGGGLSCIHPGMYGIFVLIEAVRQLRGEAGQRQVQGARLAVAHGNGGTLSTQVTNILGLEETL